ncbi:hypothetical protein [Mycobacterium paragordonae]|uniref:Uncharacterized protein n=1 Tax=Mycobacterium paragordonae TaxID=1389713 RepID=A0AAJ1W1G1_9MYCO|nr:hypothetical protein [Mycobacterium paragordonae]MDP7733671.1 hypothetical protein [Mycobacterium paragordonae]
MIVESLARALWEVVDYPRMYEWHEHPHESTREHYRDRARKLLTQFDIKPKGIR